MSDEIDQQQERDAVLDSIALRKVRDQAAAIPQGEPGICEWCECDSPRLVRGACAPCRDKHKLG